jgi:hypothetical protein
VADLVERAPLDTTIIVFHSAVLNYLIPTARAKFTEVVRALPCHWIANEGAGVLPEVDAKLTVSSEECRGKFVVSLDGTPQGLAGGHGQFLGWTNQTCTASN